METLACQRLTISTRGAGFYEITNRVAPLLQGSGVATLFIRHSSASLLIQENADPDVQVDLLGFLKRLAPHADHPQMNWLTHRIEGPDDMPAHIKAALLPTSLQIPVIDGEMMLGRWQGIYLVEHRDSPHQREVVVMLR